MVEKTMPVPLSLFVFLRRQLLSMHCGWLVAFLTLLSFCGASGCSRSESPDNVAKQPAPASREDVVRFCADCHAWPKPETFPRDRWRAEVVRGYRFYEDSGRTDLHPPEVEAVVAFYEAASSPDMWVDLPNPEETSQGPRRFLEETIFHPKLDSPAVSHLSIATAASDQPVEVFVSDMRSGFLSELLIPDRSSELEIVDLLSVKNPARLERCDLNGDGNLEWLLSDLGSFQPADHQEGALFHLTSDSDADSVDVAPLIDRVPRVADARAADFDGDGDQDIVAGIFGWRSTGRLVWLEQINKQGKAADFEIHPLDGRHGCSHVPLIDIDHDGDMDIIALFSQEYESVDLFLNDGTGNFSRSTLFQADDPSWGSSSIHLADIDADGDADIVMTNGDSFDSHLIKPYHSVQWLEQKEGLQFVPHHLANLPGAYCAQSGDLDGDGRLDIVASAMPQNFEANFNSLIWLKQQADHTFVQYEIETSIAQHAYLELGDLDRDGDLDIVVGHFEAAERRGAPWISIWWNEGPADSASLERVQD